MSSQIGTNKHDVGQCSTSIGDILVHSDSQIHVIQIVTYAVANPLPATLIRPEIRRWPLKPVDIKRLPSNIEYDLKNSPTNKVTFEQEKTSSSSKKLMRMHKAGWTMVKDLKDKVFTGKSTDSSVFTVLTDNPDQRTDF
jgi:hypothetical protein